MCFYNSPKGTNLGTAQISPHCWTPRILHTGPLPYRASLNKRAYKETSNVIFLRLTVFWAEEEEEEEEEEISPCCLSDSLAESGRNEKRQKLILHCPVHMKPHRGSKRLDSLLKPLGFFLWVAGLRFFLVWCDVSLWLVHLCHSFIHAVCKYTEILGHRMVSVWVALLRKNWWIIF